MERLDEVLEVFEGASFDMFKEQFGMRGLWPKMVLDRSVIERAKETLVDQQG